MVMEFSKYMWQSTNATTKETEIEVDQIPLGQDITGVYQSGVNIIDEIGCVALYSETIHTKDDTTTKYETRPVDIEFVEAQVASKDNINKDEIMNIIKISKIGLKYFIEFKTTTIFDMYTFIDAIDKDMKKVNNILLSDFKANTNNKYIDMTSYHPLLNKKVSLVLVFRVVGNTSSKDFITTVTGNWDTDRNFVRDYDYMT